MPYIIDGHNLIPKVPGLSLTALDDENQLIEILKRFCQEKRTKIEVFFDNAVPGSVRTQKHGRVTAVFTPAGQTADRAIKIRLHKLGKQSKNWTVVTSDRQVKVEALAAQARCISSEQFAAELSVAVESTSPATSTDVNLTEAEISHWLDIFDKSEDS